MLSTRAGVSSRCTGRRAGGPSRALVIARAAPAVEQLPRWPGIYKALTNARVESITPQEAKRRIDSGEWVLVDVRLSEQFAVGHPEGAVSVPIYETIDLASADFRRIAKALMFKFNGVNPVDPNPAFADAIRAAAAGKRGVITACEAGGTLRSTINFPEGKPSRSLQAAYRVLKERLSPSVAHLDRGVYGWYQADLPMEGEYKPDIGRTPSAAAEPTGQRLSQERAIKQGQEYDARPGDKKEAEAPEAKNKLWPW